MLGQLEVEDCGELLGQEIEGDADVLPTIVSLFSFTASFEWRTLFDSLVLDDKGAQFDVSSLLLTKTDSVASLDLILSDCRL